MAARVQISLKLVAAVLPARDPAAVVPFNRGSFHAAALSSADGDTTWADANCGVGVVPSATVALVEGAAFIEVPPGHIDLMSKQIAAQIELSEITVKVHRCHIMNKMGARSVADLVRMAEALGLKPLHPNTET